MDRINQLIQGEISTAHGHIPRFHRYMSYATITYEIWLSNEIIDVSVMLE